LDRSAIILAGGSSDRFGEDKGLIKLDNKALLTIVVDAVKGLVDEVIVVTSSKEQADLYSKIVSSKVRFALDKYESKGPLGGALTGFEAAEGKYSLLLAYDVPFVSKDVLSLLLDLCVGKAAVVPRWTNNEIEPLQAVYDTKQAVDAAKISLEDNEIDVCTMVSKMRGVRYVSTLVIEQLDPELRTFFNVNSPLDLKKALMMTTKQTKPKKKPDKIRY
jgi:molybdopterin-guanine dinucleotide biosynthesis protein A